MIDWIIAIILALIFHSMLRYAARSFLRMVRRPVLRETYRDENFVYYNCYPAFSKEEA